MIIHYDLFAGIGGFSLAIEEVFNNEKIKHIFCEWEQFPTAVLRQHWPEGEFWGDIAELVADTTSKRLQGELHRPRQSDERIFNKAHAGSRTTNHDFTIVTGGFPCQPFSAAGRRKGTADNRYQWPNMLAVIRNVRPEWVVAENVRGLVTWNDGMVLEQVCTDLEAEGYEVQPFIIPAVAVGAPHRRDRVWIIAHAKDQRSITQMGLERQSDQKTAEHSDEDRDAADSSSIRDGGSASKERRAKKRELESEELEGGPLRSESERRFGGDWDTDWREIALATCLPSMDDGLPRVMDGVTISRAKWRNESIKAYGNGIVHQIATQIMQAIKEENCKITYSGGDTYLYTYEEKRDGEPT